MIVVPIKSKAGCEGEVALTFSSSYDQPPGTFISTLLKDGLLVQTAAGDLALAGNEYTQLIASYETICRRLPPFVNMGQLHTIALRIRDEAIQLARQINNERDLDALMRHSKNGCPVRHALLRAGARAVRKVQTGELPNEADISLIHQLYQETK